MKKALTTSAVILGGFLGFAAVSMPTFADQSVMQSASNTMSDAMITTKVKAQLMANSVTKATSIVVATNDGVVKLSGSVTSSTEATTAVEIANSIDGVKDVNDSDLKVEGSTHPMDDSYITAKVKGLFIREKMMNNTAMPTMSVKVETTNGIVYLSGNVDTKAQEQKAIDLAKTIKGVKEVKSTLMIGKKS